ncbi:MAG TPA: class I SAM-dependent methyltransferase [Daejeonella sp.]|uniref:class I SAM-dependent methyltransferase n=1 Tax=Daejeonella sp. TaxID=2805397 RepID=UPI002ED889FE
MAAPEAIVKELIRLLDPQSVIDIGCGIGTFLYCFKKNGVEKVLGIDGDWVNRDLLYKHILPNEFLVQDLEKPLQLEEKFDLVICIEVAEHLSEKASDILIKTLTNAGKVVVFSAAIPFQGGQNHINEQWLDYWIKKFSDHEYILHDVLKPLFWNNSDIFFWYKQNMVIFTPKGYKFKLDVELEYNKLKNVIHQDLFLNKVHEINTIRNGSADKLFYIKLLLKSIFGYKNS